MTSKTSYFDRTLFRRSVKKAAPLCALYTLVWLLILPLSLPSVYEQALRAGDSVAQVVIDAQATQLYAQPANALAHAILNQLGAPAGVLSLLYGLALAWILYFWLFRASSAYFYASLPVRREALFTTNYLTGLAAFLAPHALVALVTCCVTAALGCALPVYCLQWFAITSLYCLFFYSFAVFLVMIVGQMAAMPLVYLILNFAVYLIYSIVVKLMKTFVYGLPLNAGSAEGFFVRLSPVWALITYRGPICVDDTVFHEALGYYETGAPYLYRSWYAFALGAAGLVFAVLALLLLKKREMERSGDVIAVRWLRPVFLYAFTVGCALVIGWLIMGVVSDSAMSSNFILVMLFLFLGAFIGYFTAQMMLQKTVRVFRRGWLGLGVCCLGLLALFGAARLDITGYSGHIPAADEIIAVSIDTGYSALYDVTDADAIADVLALHENILSSRAEQERLAGTAGPTTSRSVTLRYTLTGGKELTRYYQLYAPYDSTDETNALVQFAAVYNATPFVKARNLPSFAVTSSNVATCRIEGQRGGSDGAYDGLNLSSAEAYTFYTTCILPDLEDSSLGRMSFGSLTDAAETTAEAFNYTPCTVEFRFVTADGGETNSYFSVPLDAKRTVAYLEELGFDSYWNSEEE